MPDFDTRRLQRQNVPNEPRIAFIATKLRPALMANRLRALLIGGGILLFVAAVPVGLFIYSSSHQEDGSSPEDLSAAANGNSALNQAEEEGGELNSAIPVGPAQQLVCGIRDVGLYAMDPAGSNPTRLTDGDSPAWSPDGKRIAYTKNLKEPNPEASSPASSSATAEPFTGTPSIFVIKADGSGGRQLLDKAAVQPVWSPDGKQIAYTNGEGLDESGGSDTTDVYVVNASAEEGGTDQPRALTDSDPGTAGGPSWSPDGSEIAFTYAGQYVNGKGGIYKMNADGSGKTPIALSQRIKTKEGQWDFKTSPVWSPHGDQIAYVRGVPLCDPYCGGSIYFQHICIMDSSGLNPTLIRDIGAGHEVTGLDWRPLP